MELISFLRCGTCVKQTSTYVGCTCGQLTQTGQIQLKNVCSVNLESTCSVSINRICFTVIEAFTSVFNFHPCYGHNANATGRNFLNPNRTKYYKLLLEEM